MSWMKKLYDTYETALNLPVVEGKLPLMPISHTPQNAHINIILDGEGNFHGGFRLARKMNYQSTTQFWIFLKKAPKIQYMFLSVLRSLKLVIMKVRVRMKSIN